MILFAYTHYGRYLHVLYLYFLNLLTAVLSSVECVRSQVQAAADWHSSTEQPRGAVPLTQLPQPTELQVSQHYVIPNYVIITSSCLWGWDGS